MAHSKAVTSHETPAAATAHPAAVEGAGKWLALTAALLGWMFDGAEMGVFSLVGGKAMEALLPSSSKTDQSLWFQVIMATFLVGAATGGVLFGWLGDRIGRVRAMTLSVLTYAVFTGLCGFAGAAWQVAALRFIASLGMGGEWSLGVALVMEVWPNRSRAFMAGLIGAAANVGYLLVGYVGLVLLDFLETFRGIMLNWRMQSEWVESLCGHSGWRLMMLLGTVPAVLTFFIRVFVPESEKWKKEEGSGTTSHWASQDLLAVAVGVLGPMLIIGVWAYYPAGLSPWATNWAAIRVAVTILGLMIAIVGYTYPVVRFFQRNAAVAGGAAWLPTLGRMMLAACLSGVALLGTWGTTQQAPTWASDLTEASYRARYDELVAAGQKQAADELPKAAALIAKERTLIWLSWGAIVGTLGAALAGDFIGRRPAYCLLCILSLLSVWMLYLGNQQFGPGLLFWAFVAGVCTASFYGWLPLYLPELFPTSVRATGQGFGFNFGRILAAIGVLQVGNFVKVFTADWQWAGFVIPHGRPLACSLIALVYFIGMAIIWLAPETRGQPLPD